ncbi:Ribonuclease H-like protein [Metarhizium robertsii ARSEF 23]|uniref:Ribonuclease H-like protein n=1 Tax=Metarhizium robertsii (strain ARSEF 23 / ATCC MYA-3075) TaxID=655844 RepID=E9EM98_METRA|nr:Ribonuclease H-like protein [Metarhizium robertsii ARSEF 23]EFZ04526.1 Ribonuclease H-like protein [Metarhizium robertsii ARSEF 23]
MYNINPESNNGQNVLYSMLKKVGKTDALDELLIEWVTTENLPFRIVESTSFQNILLHLNPAFKGRIPSAMVLRDRLDTVYKQAQGPVTELLATARGRIHVTFDGWTSRNRLSLLGINVFFIDVDWRHRKLLLGLPSVQGRHTGENLADEVASVLAYFGIDASRLGYFVLDNARNNDTAVAALADEFDFDLDHRRLRCLGHILNLVVKQLIFGDSASAMETEDDDDFDFSTISDELKKWRKKGPVGRLHNFVGAINNSPQLVQRLLEWQKEDIASGKLSYIDKTTGKLKKPLMPISDNETRWNSRYRMMQRAKLLRSYFSRLVIYIQEQWEHEKLRKKGIKKPTILDDKLEDSDWDVIEVFLKILGAFDALSTRLQGNGEPDEDGHIRSGAFWEYFQSFEFLLSHLEKLKINTDLVDGLDSKSVTMVRSHINLAWEKLDSYYQKLCPPAYAAAIVLHPCYGWAALAKYFKGNPNAKEWLAEHKHSVKKLWEKDYQNMPLKSAETASSSSKSTSHKRRSEFETFLDSAMEDDEDDMVAMDGSIDPLLDEYERYCRTWKRADPQLYRENPYLWWKAREKEYPRLSRMASDFLSIPAMSAQTEREFSSCGRMVGVLRTRLDRWGIAMSQCIRSWKKEGII